MSKPRKTRPTAPGGAERRSAPRKAYPHQILVSTEAEGKSRGLIANDLSAGGMRVEASDLLQLGDELKLALYCDSRRPPVVVHALVTRDDGENGWMLMFHDVNDHTATNLALLLDSLPEVGEGEGVDASGLVSEILERAEAT
jgi:hypothetical protein